MAGFDPKAGPVGTDEQAVHRKNDPGVRDRDNVFFQQPASFVHTASIDKNAVRTVQVTFRGEPESGEGIVQFFNGIEATS